MCFGECVSRRMFSPFRQHDVDDIQLEVGIVLHRARARGRYGLSEGFICSNFALRVALFGAYLPKKLDDEFFFVIHSIPAYAC